MVTWLRQNYQQLSGCFNLILNSQLHSQSHRFLVNGVQFYIDSKIFCISQKDKGGIKIMSVSKCPPSSPPLQTALGGQMTPTAPPNRSSSSLSGLWCSPPRFRNSASATRACQSGSSSMVRTGSGFFSSGGGATEGNMLVSSALGRVLWSCRRPAPNTQSSSCPSALSKGTRDTYPAFKQGSPSGSSRARSLRTLTFGLPFLREFRALLRGLCFGLCATASLVRAASVRGVSFDAVGLACSASLLGATISGSFGGANGLSSIGP